MNISIAPEFESFVNAQLESGTYGSANELVYDALRLLCEREEVRQMRTQKLNREIQLGLDDIAAGRVVTMEESKARTSKLLSEFENNARRI